MTMIHVTIEGEQAEVLVEQLFAPRIAVSIPVEPAPRSYREPEYTVDQARILELLEEAVRMRAPVDITYEDLANDTFTRRNFSPSKVRGSLAATRFVTGYCHAREDARSFRINRIRALEVR